MTVNQTSRAPFRRPVGPGAEGRLRAILGPTNTGKTHLAVERMLAHASGMIGLPLRLLAREIYDKVARQRGAGAVALITGEEKIVPARPHYFVCTVEAMPVDMDVEFLAVDEIQLMADPERGHVFTDRLLNARGRYETLFLGSASAARLVRLLVPAVEIETRARFSQLTHVGARKLSRLPRRSAVVAFSAEAVYVIAELIRRQSGGAAVVMGSLSPRTRNAQVALYQSGEVDFLIATDAIGMGLNMDLGHVAFAGLSKFDGRRTRPLTAQEVAQIAGRAGRHVRDGTFGTTASAPPVDPEMAEAVENHRFEALGFAWWRNAELDFSSLEALSRSLAEPPAREGLRASEEALDERTLSALSADPAVTARATGREALRRLWEVCQTPDFRKTTFEEHRRLAGELFSHLGSRRERIPGEWMAHQLAPLDRLDGGIDALSQRLASGRTLAYAANRPDWVEDAEHWRDLARALEDRLSDALHEKLMAQFVDRRTSALVRGLARGGDLLAGLAADGAVSVEGHYVGHLRGLSFERAGAAEGLARRAIDAAAAKAVGPEVARRLGALAAEPDEGFAVQPDGLLIWRGEAVGVIDRARPLSPTARLFGELGPWQARRRAQTRLDAFLAAEAGRRLAPLQRLQDAVAQGRIRGLARGLAWRLAEAGGVLARGGLEADLASLSRGERRALRSLGVRIGAFHLGLPALHAPEARPFAAALVRRLAPDWRPAEIGLQPLVEPAPPPLALGLSGRTAIGPVIVSVERLERLDQVLRSAPRREGGFAVGATELAALEWTTEEAETTMQSLGFAQFRTADGVLAWRRRRNEPRRDRTTPARDANSAFAVLAPLASPPSRRIGRRSPRARRAHG